MENIIIFEGQTITKLPDFKVSDFGQLLTFHILNKDGSAVDLTTTTILFIAKKLNDFDENLFTVAGVVTDAALGYCTITIPDELDETGSFDSFLTLTDGVTSINTINLGYLNIWE